MYNYNYIGYTNRLHLLNQEKKANGNLRVMVPDPLPSISARCCFTQTDPTDKRIRKRKHGRKATVLHWRSLSLICLNFPHVVCPQGLRKSRLKAGVSLVNAARCATANTHLALMVTLASLALSQQKDKKQASWQSLTGNRKEQRESERERQWELTDNQWCDVKQGANWFIWCPCHVKKDKCLVLMVREMKWNKKTKQKMKQNIKHQTKNKKMKENTQI